MQNPNADRELREEFRAWKVEIEDMLRLLTERVAALENAATVVVETKAAKASN